MLTAHPNKYALRDLHREIGFFDRKIAHCQTQERFASDFAREAALQKLVTRRQKLVKSAAVMVSAGVPFDAKDLPVSLRDDQGAAAKVSA
jgi:hypothetical protein